MRATFATCVALIFVTTQLTHVMFMRACTVDSSSDKCFGPVSFDQKPSLYKDFTAVLSDIIGVDVTEGRKWCH